MATRHILVLDEGTTSTRAILFDKHSRPVMTSSRPLRVQAYSDGRVEQDAEEIWESSRQVIADMVKYAIAHEIEIVALGAAVQRTSTVVWDAQTGLPVAPVVSWQDARASTRVDELQEDWGSRFHKTTGLVMGAANVALHLEWLLSNDSKLERLAREGRLRVGTPETWIIWKLTQAGESGPWVTSASCAGSSGMWNLGTKKWFTDFLATTSVSIDALPTVLPDDGDFGTTDPSLIGAALPITGILGDQQAALFGHGGLETGSVKCTHGTGSFIDFNVGAEQVDPGIGLDCRFGWTLDSNPSYVVEGGSFVTGSGIDWMVDKLRVLSSPNELDHCYSLGDPNSGLISVPALAGFAAPYWDAAARGMMIGFHRGTTAEDVVRATVDGVAHSGVDVIEAMTEGTGVAAKEIAIDGGLGRSDALLQAQADLLQVPVVRAAGSEYITARGAAWYAGHAAGMWSDVEAFLATKEPGKEFLPLISEDERDHRRAAWKDATSRALGWRRP